MSTPEKNINGKSPIYWDVMEAVKSGIKHQETSLATEKKLKELKEEVLTAVEKSHMAMAEVQSNTTANLIEKIESMTKKVEYTNGKVGELWSWREQIKGAKGAIKGAWGIVAIYVFAMSFGLFQMWADFQKIDQRIRDIVVEELEYKHLIK